MRRVSFFVILILHLAINPLAFAQYGSRQVGDDIFQSRINEYFYSKNNSDVLHPVKIIGSVQKPGLYHLPAQTSLTTLFSISGGVTPDADTESIIIRRADGTILEKDLFKVVAKSDDVSLLDGDMIYIPKQEGWINAPTGSSILILTSVLSVILSGIIVSRGSN